MDMKHVEKVIDRLVDSNAPEAVEKYLAEQRELSDVLGAIINMAKQLKEKETLDKAIQKKRDILTDVENDIEESEKECLSQIDRLNNKVEGLRGLLGETKKNVARKIREAEVNGNKEIAQKRVEVDERIGELANEVLVFEVKSKAAEADCIAMESTKTALKESLINI